MLLDMIIKSADAIGIIGVVLLLIAYCLLNVNKMSALDLSYQLFNFAGAGFILFSLFFNWNTASVIIEIAWMVISLIGMYRAIHIQNQQKASRGKLYVIKDMNLVKVNEKI